MRTQIINPPIYFLRGTPATTESGPRCETGIPHLKGDHVPDLMQKLLLILVSDPEERACAKASPWIHSELTEPRRCSSTEDDRRRCKDTGCKKLDDPHSLKHNEMVECRFQPQQWLHSLPHFTKRLSARSKTCHTLSTPLRAAFLCATRSRTARAFPVPRNGAVILGLVVSCESMEDTGAAGGHDYVTCSFEPQQQHLVCDALEKRIARASLASHSLEETGKKSKKCSTNLAIEPDEFLDRAVSDAFVSRRCDSSVRRKIKLSFQ